MESPGHAQIATVTKDLSCDAIDDNLLAELHEPLLRLPTGSRRVVVLDREQGALALDRRQAFQGLIQGRG